MTSAHAALTFEVPNAALLEQLATAPLPLQLIGVTSDTRIYREAYFDTPDGTLQRQGVSCSLRTERDRPALLVVAAIEPLPGDAAQGVFETMVTGAGRWSCQAR